MKPPQAQAKETERARFFCFIEADIPFYLATKSNVGKLFQKDCRKSDKFNKQKIESDGKMFVNCKLSLHLH